MAKEALVNSEQDPGRLDELRHAMRQLTRADEEACVGWLVDHYGLTDERRRAVSEFAASLITASRDLSQKRGTLDVFLQEFGLSSHEGVALMCLAEALLRIPNPEIADQLIAEKLTLGNWKDHAGHSDSAFVNAGTWALMLTGRVLDLDAALKADVAGFLGALVRRAGEPVIRRAVLAAMRIMGGQFVMGQTIKEALSRSASEARPHETASFDMLGEGARTNADAARYTNAYEQAIEAIGKAAAGAGPSAGPGLSIKLSALHPRLEQARSKHLEAELLPRLTALARQAAGFGIGFTIDAEEADRLDLTLSLFAALAADPGLAGWDGLGLAVQAYQKRAPAVIDWLTELARQNRRRLMLRLVKGAYWDSEIKHAQELGLADYPVFTRKASTDLCYLVCAQKLAACGDAIYPQFATHNAHTIAAVHQLMGGRRDYEFQRLHGMGDLAFRALEKATGPVPRVRVYAPVGAHQDLLPYLVRRLLENGVNSSFVNRFMDREVAVAELAADPGDTVAAAPARRHRHIPLPGDLYGPERRNSAGIDLAAPDDIARLYKALEPWHDKNWSAAPDTPRTSPDLPSKPVTNPARCDQVVGQVSGGNDAAIDPAFDETVAAQPDWDRLGGTARGALLRKVADSLEAARPELMALLIREAGKTIPDALSEVREAVDFCRYYARQAEEKFSQPLSLPGPTGEENSLALAGRGVFVCISPWNFPLAIFTGQVAAALAAGNAVIAKPAGQTPLIGAEAVRLFHAAGIPRDLLHLMPGSGATVGNRLVADPRTAGVAFTGSTETARSINRCLAGRDAPIVPFIAETGGQNAMLVDSTALAEQVCDDAVRSAFLSAGQRCSALRVLFLEKDIADGMMAMIAGAMETLTIGDPWELATDVGPVIDAPARDILQAHADRMSAEATLIKACPLPGATAGGTFFAPHMFEIERLDIPEREVFGPILHVIRYDAGALDQVIAAIKDTGYGLTLGIHSRIEGRVHYITERLSAGNTYVNRNMIGAVVGVQPFGGEGLSGTGPKAGGPNYLPRFAKERSLSVNSAATGGNAGLFSLAED